MIQIEFVIVGWLPNRLIVRIYHQEIHLDYEEVHHYTIVVHESSEQILLLTNSNIHQWFLSKSAKHSFRLIRRSHLPLKTEHSID